MNMVLGVSLIAVGLLLRYLVGWRRFKRRNVAGLQVYANYLSGLTIGFLERLINLAGLALIIAGMLLLLMHFFFTLMPGL